jgi:hypothetical protein
MLVSHHFPRHHHLSIVHQVKRTCLKRGYVYQSVRCPTHFLQPIARQNNHSFIGALGPPNGFGKCPDSEGAFRIGGGWCDRWCDRWCELKKKKGGVSCEEEEEEEEDSVCV